LDPLGINTPEIQNHLAKKIDFMELRIPETRGKVWK